MSWPKPLNSRSKVNQAGDLLRHYTTCKPDEFDVVDYLNAFEVMTNWRSCHGYPINTFQATLRSRLDSVDRQGIIAQRLKRTPSIIDKLVRFPHMKLARIQDIGGLRAIVKDIKSVRKVCEKYKTSRSTHELHNESDYITNPKDSGYRGIHLVYKYRNPRDCAAPYNGLLIEIQLRTKLQHSWATAVETVGTFLKHSLKSSKGPEEWLEFFKIVGSAFAYKEGTPRLTAHSGLSRREIAESAIVAAEELGVRNKLNTFTIAARHISTVAKKSGYFYLLILDPDNLTVSVEPFSKTQLEVANQKYASIEKDINNGSKVEAVLVSAGSIDQLKRAYPNYFLDTRTFVDHLYSLEKHPKNNI